MSSSFKARAKYCAALIRLGHFADRQMSGGRGRQDNGMLGWKKLVKQSICMLKSTVFNTLEPTRTPETHYRKVADCFAFVST